jgi:hypothetical protein
MSQFRKTGQLYCSEWNGDDLNAGTLPTLPKKNITAFPDSSANKIIVGSGQYLGVWTTGRNVEADGKVIVDLNGGNQSGNTVAVGVHFRNGSQIFNIFFNNIATDCIFENIAIILSRVTYTRCIFLSSHNNTGTTVPAFNNCIFLANRIITSTGVGNFNHSYVAKSATITFSATVGQVNSCINGKMRISGIDYESKKFIDGSTRTDADPLIPDIVTVFPNFYTQGNFACLDSEVKFIDIISRTVEPDSILLQKSNANGFIGGVKIGKKIDLDESGFTITKTGIDDSNPNFWRIAAGVNFAKIRITGKVSDSLISAQTLDIRIPFNFDGDVAGNTANNNNVPDAWNDRTTPDTKGTRPNRLTFEVRSSTLANPSRDVSADWDNDNTNNPSIAGRYYLMEYDQPMLHHVISSVVYGNADANAINAATKLPFNYRSLDIIITITNTRTI